MRCVDCGADSIFGKHFETLVTENGVTRAEIRCELCAENIAEIFWPDDWGPYRHKISRDVGNA